MLARWLSANFGIFGHFNANFVLFCSHGRVVKKKHATLVREGEKHAHALLYKASIFS